MTRMEKYKDLHEAIAFENIDCMLNDFETWVYIRNHQKEIKQEMGCKH